MFDKLKEINSRPEPYQFYTAEELWTDDILQKRCSNIISMILLIYLHAIKIS